MEEIQKIDFGDKNYPELLKKIPDPPKVLYFRGELKKDEPCFGVVGTRRYSSYGKQATLDIVGDLAQAGVVIVSGLAPGIDTFAHIACLEKGGKTIAILGTGLDKKSIYPQSNLKLAEEIVKSGGCLLSELEPRIHGSKITFPKRNRIISGISQGVLVVEAKQKSGSLITANYAFGQNRKVFAVPGPIYSSNSKGSNWLIKRGAKLVDSADDILQELNLNAATRSQKYNENLTPEEKLVIQVLSEESLYVDKIIEKTKLNANIAVSTLSLLEIKGKIRNLGGNVYALRH